MIILAIAGRVLNLDIVDYVPTYEAWDSEATGRTRAVGAPMLRFPEGVFVNFAIEIHKPRSDDSDFDYLMDKFFEMNSPGHIGMLPVTHRDMQNRAWSQLMYYVIDGASSGRITAEYVQNDNVKVRFIAERAR